MKLEKNKWYLVSENIDLIPKDEDLFIRVVYKYWVNYDQAWYAGDDCFWNDNQNFKDVEVTHFMIPEVK